MWLARSTLRSSFTPACKPWKISVPPEACTERNWPITANEFSTLAEGTTISARSLKLTIESVSAELSLLTMSSTAVFTWLKRLPCMEVLRSKTRHKFNGRCREDCAGGKISSSKYNTCSVSETLIRSRLARTRKFTIPSDCVSASSAS